jgi:3'(2'), 5'-bisphosphate nucleotidase
MAQIELQAAKEAARQAAKVCQLVYQEMVEGVEKVGREPVTIADYASQAIIIRKLRETCPQDGFMGEEHAADFTARLSAEQRARVASLVGTEETGIAALLDPPAGSSGRLWIIDPIDGTKGFLGKRAYAVAIALRDSEGLVLGVLACPNLSLENPGELAEDGVLFYAVRGEGAFREPLSGGEAVKMQVAPQDSPLRMATSVESGHSDQGLFSGVVAGLPGDHKETFKMDGQGKYGLVADGRATAYFRMVPDPEYREKIWDHAAGAIIVEEAGGIVSDFEGTPLDFASGAKMVNNRGVVVSSASLYPILLEAIRRSQS